MKFNLLIIGMLASTVMQAASIPSQLGVVPLAANGFVPWSTVNNYLQSSNIMTNNFSGFQYYQNNNYYYVGDNKLAAFKNACSQPNGTVTIKRYVGGQWQDTTVSAATVAQALLQSTRMGSIFFTGEHYQPLSTLFSNTAYNNLQLNLTLIEQSMNSVTVLNNFNAYYLESIPYMYVAMMQNYIGRVFTGATALQQLFNFSGTYNGQAVNNALIQQNFLKACTYALESSQYALSAFGEPVDVTQNPFSPATQSTVNQNTPPATYSQVSSPYGNTSALGLTSNMSQPSGSTSVSTPATVVPQQGPTMSLLDTFAGVIVINSIAPVTSSGVTYNVGFGPESLTPVNGVQPNPTPTTPYGVVFSGQSGFIPATGAVDNWTPVSNSVTAGRSVGINYGVYASQPSLAVAYGSNATTLTVTFGSNENTVEVYDNVTMSGSPLAVINLANFFVIPTPWALVVNISGFMTAPNAQITSPCLYITPAALSTSAQNLFTQSMNQQMQNGTAPSSCVDLTTVLCQSNGQPIAQNPDVLGIVKLNPYDFPFQFTQATSVMTPQYSSPTQSQSSLSAAQTGAAFSMQDVYNSSAMVYAKAFPDNFHDKDVHGYYKNIAGYVTPNSTGSYNPYALGYLLLQGLCNGYLMMSSADTPVITRFQEPYSLGTDLGKNLTGLSSFAAQYPQPSEVDWFRTSGFDYLMIRSLMVMRYFVRTLNIRAVAVPYIQQILKKINAPYQPVNSMGKPTGSVVYFGQNPAKGYNVYAPAVQPTYGAVQICAASASAPSTVSVGGGASL